MNTGGEGNSSTGIPYILAIEDNPNLNFETAVPAGWVELVAISGVAFVVTFYIAAAFGVDLYKAKQTQRSAVQEKELQYGRAMKWARLAFAVCVLVNCPVVEKVIVDLYDPEMCAGIRRMRGSAGNLAMLLSYTVMWIRQRSVYENPAVQHLTTRFKRFLSVAVGVLVVASPLTTMAIYLTSFTFGMTASGCAIVGSTIPPQTIWFIIGATSVVMQTGLLGLFLHPLLKHQGNMRESRNQDSGKIRNIIQRSFVTSLVCAVSDTICTYVSASSVLNDGISLPLMMHVTLFVDLIMVVLAFPEWSVTMFPCSTRLHPSCQPKKPSGQMLAADAI